MPHPALTPRRERPRSAILLDLLILGATMVAHPAGASGTDNACGKILAGNAHLHGRTELALPGPVSRKDVDSHATAILQASQNGRIWIANPEARALAQFQHWNATPPNPENAAKEADQGVGEPGRWAVRPAVIATWKLACKDPPTPGTARQILQQAIQEAGLAGLYWPQAQEQDPFSMLLVARGIQDTERNLRELTGMPPGIMGLYGRIALELDEPEFSKSTQIAGSARKINGGTLIRTSWGSYGHEWIHALENAMWEQNQSKGGQHVAWLRAYGELQEEARQWLHELRMHGKLVATRIPGNDPDYFIRSGERMAFAFEHTLDPGNPDTALLTRRKNSLRPEPSSGETHAIRQIYSRLFARPEFRTLADPEKR